MRLVCVNLQPQDCNDLSKDFISRQEHLVVQEHMPALVRVLCYPIRAVARSLLSNVEKEAVASIVSIMIAYNLELDMSATNPAANSPALILKPEINLLCCFEVRRPDQLPVQ